MRKVTRIGRKPVKGGVQLDAYSQSPRGTYFMVGSKVVYYGDQSKKEFRLKLAEVTEELLGG